MANSPAFHSIKLGGALVYHNDTRCTEGNNIERVNFRWGVGVGRRLCVHCRALLYRR